MVDPKLVDVLRKISLRLENSRVNWALVGSLGLAIRGAPVEPHDIDIMTDRDGAYEIQRTFLEFVTRGVALRVGKNIISHFGALEIDGVKVEIMGDFQILLEDGSWQKSPDLISVKEVVQFEGMSIPVLSLEHTRDSYTKLGRLDRAEQARTLLLASRN
jgi:hypothetical protein